MLLVSRLQWLTHLRNVDSLAYKYFNGNTGFTFWCLDFMNLSACIFSLLLKSVEITIKFDFRFLHITPLGLSSDWLRACQLRASKIEIQCQSSSSFSYTRSFLILSLHLRFFSVPFTPSNPFNSIWFYRVSWGEMIKTEFKTFSKFIHF